MNGNQIEGLVSMVLVLGILVLMALPSVLGVLRDRRLDRQIREARRTEEAGHGRRTGDRRRSVIA
ncbi:hypothetical protein ACFV2H_00065 [Streptomyces sp. NPDC059629]|uniref:hypothetical protein n=1 Tax=Streptomyces sp. NPDC059629 TaxID=3346889 RepID=UPI0036A03E8C